MTASFIPGHAPHMSRMVLVDEFMGGSQAVGVVGELGWVTVSGGGSRAQADSTANHPGIQQLNSSTTSGNSSGMALASLGTGNAIAADDLEHMLWIVKAETGAAAIEVAIGLMDSVILGGAETTDGIYFTFKDAVDPHWRTITREAGVATATNTTVTYTVGNWYVLQARRSGASIIFSINGVDVATHTTNLPTSVYNLGANVKTTATGAKAIQVDRFEMRTTQLGQRWT